MLRTPGSKLGVYEILGPLGAGGMGEVHLARDTRLDREVALKLLPPRMSHDSDAMARFRREALTIASLNHPNIATVHGFDEAPDGSMVLVLERVEGETLADRLRHGRLPVEEALQICAQIAQALEAAHERGVIHRDVKPGNVMIGPRGLVKVLDFGLARNTFAPGRRRPTQDEATPPEAGAVSHDARMADEDAPTLTHAPLAFARLSDGHSGSDTDSAPGMIVGTPGYMSPEQVRADELDQRTDIFSFGCVLYECLAGRRAFRGEDSIQTMAAVLDQTPDPLALPPRTPQRVRSLVAKCLEKEPSNRLAAIRSARIELEEALGIRRASALREGVYTTPHNLPSQSTSFVGRHEVLRECGRLLGSTRMLTLTGMGGSGKTRIALRLAESALESHPDGVWFVDLAPVTDPSRVAGVAAEALGVADEAECSPLESLAHHVGDRRMLFVVDNCEEVIEGVAALASALLNACREVRILATSREALGLEGETVFAVPTLAVPDLGGSTDADALMECDAVRLFSERARAAQPDFSITAATARPVQEICRRLDGIPLALELAAARVRMLSVEQIRDRLGDHFKLLTRAGSGGPLRQQTVRAVIQWSWDHLLPPEQDLMRRLAVFTGGWTLERATAVCSDVGDDFALLDLLTRLAERSIVVVQRDATGNPRYRFLESVWRFALEKLEAHAEHEALRERHLAVYLAFAEQAEITMTGPGLAQQLTEVAHEEENLLAALAWSGRSPDGALRGLRLAQSVSRFWSVRGRYQLGRRALEDALGREGASAPSRERARALTRAAGFALVMGQHESARVQLEECLAYWRASGDRKGLPSALAGLGVVAMFQLRLEDAIALGEESLAIYTELGNTRGVAMALHNLGTIESALARPDHGRARFESGLVLLREVGDHSSEALCLAGLTCSLVRLGDIAGAGQRLRECFVRLERLGAPREGVYAVESLAELRLALGHPADAARLIGAAGAARLVLGLPHMPIERIDMQRLTAAIAESLGAVETERLFAAGREIPLDTIVAEARTRLGLDSSGQVEPGLPGISAPLRPPA